MDRSPSKKDVEEAMAVVLSAHKKFLEGSREGVPLNMSGADLRHAVFDDANFSRASLKNTDFSRANMEGAKLSRALIKDTTLPKQLRISKDSGNSR